MKSFNTSMLPICLVIAMMTILLSRCDGVAMKSMKPTTDTKGKIKERRRAMEKPTTTPTSAPVTPAPTRFPTVSPTDEPTPFPTAYPTEKKSMQRSPQAIAEPTNFPVAVTVPVPTTTVEATSFPSPDVDDVPVSEPAPVQTDAPFVVATPPPTLPPTTLAPTTELPSLTPSSIPTEAPFAVPSSAPSVAPSGAPIVSTNIPTAFPTVAPTYSNLTSQLNLSDFSILLLSFDMSSAVNVGLVESTLENYMNRSMLLENLVDVSLTPIAASSAPGSNFTATSIQFAGKSSFIIEVPTQQSLSLSQDGVLLSSLSVPNIQKTFALDPSLSTIRVVSVTYGTIDPNSVVDVKPISFADEDVGIDGDNKDVNNESGSGGNNSGRVIGFVLAFSVFLVIGALFVIRQRRNKNAKKSGTTAVVTKPLSARKLGESYYPSLRRQYPDIEKPKEERKEESVQTPNEEEDEDDESSAADLSSYMMSHTGSIATDIKGTTTILKDSDKVEKTIIQASSAIPVDTEEERPTVEISVSHIEEVADDEDYTSTDDGSARFGATDMSECTFRA